MASPIPGRRRQIRHQSFCIRQGAVEVNPDYEMEIDDKRQEEGKDSASSDTATDDTDFTDTVSANTAATDTDAAEPPPEPLRGGRGAGVEMGRRRCRWQWKWREMGICVPYLQVPTINKGKSYYHFTATYCCSVSFSSLSVQTSNFAAPPISFYLSKCSLKYVVLSHIMSEASGHPSAFLSYLLKSSILFNVMRVVQIISSSPSLSIMDFSKIRISSMIYGTCALIVNFITVIVWVLVLGFSSCIILIQLAKLVFPLRWPLFLFLFILIYLVSKFTFCSLLISRIVFNESHFFFFSFANF